MKRIEAVTYKSDKGTTLLSVEDGNRAYISSAFMCPDQLDEMASACAAAAEELRARAAKAEKVEQAEQQAA